MDGRSKVLVIESRYETWVQAVERVFAAFPLEIKGKNVLVKVNALRACNPDREAIVTHPALLKAVIGKLETLAPRRIIVGDSVGTEFYGNSQHVFDAPGLAAAAGTYHQYLSLHLTMIR